MAAGLGFKTFTTGEVLTAANVNGYLMQGVLVFASAAARDAAITSPQEGQACYLKDTNQVLTYSGTAWVAVGGGSPLTTKGDLYTYSTTDARLAVGTNNFTLVADSAEATGLKYVAGVSIAFNAQTAAYTLVASDAFKLVTVNDSASRTVTIPPSIFTAGQIINVQRIGTGAVPFAAGSGVTITSTGATSAAPTLRAQFSAASIVCTASNVFTVLGDIS